ncbi:MAG: iron-sulfur cluster repair protein YtfE [Alphaproteobacteria bacterium]|nr:iron-sulfur cluster repair protein YtfE [Alphaproteobacteria bacterium]
MGSAIKKFDEMTLGEIAANVPGATAVFRRHNLDFCCAGYQSFAQAVADKALDKSTIVEELSTLHVTAADAGGFPAAATDTPTLVNYIISRFHEEHRDQFPELIQLAGKVEKVHADNLLCPKGLEEHLRDMFSELLTHMDKEENILFPMLAKGVPCEQLGGPIAMMESEHEDHARALLAIRELTHNGKLPQEACNSWQALYHGLAQLEEDLANHIHLENNILFVR